MGDTKQYAIVGETYTNYFGLTPAGGGDSFQSTPTIAAGDFTISVDSGATFANMDNLPAVVAGDAKVVSFTLSAAETTAIGAGGIGIIMAVDAAGAEWQDLMITVPVRAEEVAVVSDIPTVTEITADIDANSTQLAAIDGDTSQLLTDLADGGRTDLLIDAILDDTGTAGVVINAATIQAIADALLSRGAANVEDSAEALSIAELLLATFESGVVGATWTIRKSGGTTFSTRTVTTDPAAEPVVGVT